MRYPEELKIIVDVTKPPYCADNTGKVDCTDALRRAYNDIIMRSVELFNETFEKLSKSPENVNTYLGFQSRHCCNGGLNVSYSEHLPEARIMYFPKGTYLVSDTIAYNTKKSRKYHSDKFWFELNRNIHFEGEDREETIIKLKDDAKGFEYGNCRPVIDFLPRPEAMVEHIANNAMQNSIKDITIDCGKGNYGAVGLKFYASNTGCIRNVTIKSSDLEGFAGISLLNGSSGIAKNVKIEGFTYGVLGIGLSMMLFEDIYLENQQWYGMFFKNFSAVLYNIKSKNNVHTVKVENASFSYGAFLNVEGPVDVGDNLIYMRDDVEKIVHPITKLADKDNEKISLNLHIEKTPDFTYPNVSEWVCVDEFGAIGDGVTDSTNAIQKAMNSGAEVIYFNEGRYVISNEITIPSTVKMINFCYCNMIADGRLKTERGTGAFVINEDSDNVLFMENAYTWEYFCGMFKFIRHSAKRNIVMRDIHLQAASVYFNTVSGSKVYIENVANTTGDFSEWYFYEREGEKPILASNIPFEFNGQKVFVRYIDPERADIEMVNNGGECVIMAAHTEGPGTVLETTNGGSSEIIVFSASAGTNNPEKPVILNENSDVSIVCGLILAEYPVIVKEMSGEKKNVILKDELIYGGRNYRYISGYIGEISK